MKQLVTPNVDITEKSGLCLQYARRAFHAPAVEPTAWAAWTKAKFKHLDQDFPAGVAFPVWFDWSGDIGQGRKQYGHVAVRMADGTIWSSPLSGTGRAWFKSIDALTRAFGGGMRYVGWSEDISGVKVIEGDNEMDKPSDAQIDATVSYLHFAYFGEPAPDAVFKSWRGLLKNNYVDGLQTIFENTDKNPDALKNQPQGGDKYEPVTVYRKVQ